MKIILHIGSDKCGSTAIQKVLFQNAGTLREQGIVLAAQQQGMSHDGYLCRETDKGRVMECDKFRESLAWCEEQGGDRAIFTFEGFHSVSRQSLKEAAEVLSGHEVQIVYYLREQADYVNSALLQRAKARIEVGPMLDIYHGRKNAGRGHNYRKRLLKWKKFFPDATYSVRIFERDRLHSGDAVDDFFHCLDIPMEGIEKADGAVNTSITMETAVALQYMEALGMDSLAGSAVPGEEVNPSAGTGNIAIGVGNRLGGCTKLLPRKQVMRIRLRNLRDNFWVARNFCDRSRLFRFKPLKRQEFNEERVLEILRGVGAQAKHCYIRQGFILQDELLGFVNQGFDANPQGVVMREGENRLRLRCGTRHSQEVYNEFRLELELDAEKGPSDVEIAGERREFSGGAASFDFPLSAFPILETFEVVITVEGGNCLLTGVRVTFR